MTRIMTGYKTSVYAPCPSQEDLGKIHALLRLQYEQAMAGLGIDPDSREFSVEERDGQHIWVSYSKIDVLDLLKGFK